MLEDGLRLYSPSGAFHTSRDSVPNKKASESNVTANCNLRTNTINSVGEELSVLGNQVENNTFHYQLNQVTEPAVRDLGFLDSSHQDKENGGLLYYGWPEIETFEDVDKMFRSCDSTFGLGIDNEDELSWFSSSHVVEESNDVLKPDFMFSGPDSDILDDAIDCDEILRQNDAACACVTNETHEKDASTCHDSCSETLYDNKTADVINSSFESGSETTIQIEAGDQSISKQSQRKLQTSGKRRGLNLENGNHLDKPNQIGHLTQNMGCSFSERTEYEQSTPLQTRNKPFTIKSEENGGQSLFKNDTYQMQYKEKIVQKNFGSDVDGQSTVDEGGPCIPGELDSSNAQDSACLSSMVEEVSLEATTFLQLQHVIEKLDGKTKLCIRDSMYRLAQSAEQRHKCSIFTIGGDGDRSGTFASDETDKCRRFMDIETDTNPIDRSVAHLLFHRPPDIAVSATPLTKVQIQSGEKPVPVPVPVPVLQESSNGAGFGASTVE